MVNVLNCKMSKRTADILKGVLIILVFGSATLWSLLNLIEVEDQIYLEQNLNPLISISYDAIAVNDDYVESLQDVVSGWNSVGDFSKYYENEFSVSNIALQQAALGDTSLARMEIVEQRKVIESYKLLGVDDEKIFALQRKSSIDLENAVNKYENFIKKSFSQELFLSTVILTISVLVLAAVVLIVLGSLRHYI